MRMEGDFETNDLEPIRVGHEKFRRLERWLLCKVADTWPSVAAGGMGLLVNDGAICLAVQRSMEMAMGKDVGVTVEMQKAFIYLPRGWRGDRRGWCGGGQIRSAQAPIHKPQTADSRDNNVTNVHLDTSWCLVGRVVADLISNHYRVCI